MTSYKVARQKVLYAFERAFIRKLLLKTGGNVSKASRLAEIDRKHFWRIMRRTLGPIRRTKRKSRR